MLNQQIVHPHVTSNGTPFRFLSPGGGEIFEAGSKVRIVFADAEQLPSPLSFSLIGLRRWTVELVLTVEEMEPGVFSFTIPADLFANSANDITPIDGFQIFVHDEGPTTWRYSETFMIWCGAGSYYPIAKPFKGVYPLPVER